MEKETILFILFFFISVNLKSFSENNGHQKGTTKQKSIIITDIILN
jgi:hypothetical protein